MLIRPEEILLPRYFFQACAENNWTSYDFAVWIAVYLAVVDPFLWQVGENSPDSAVFPDVFWRINATLNSFKL